MLKNFKIISITFVLFFVVSSSFYSCKPKKDKDSVDTSTNTPKRKKIGKNGIFDSDINTKRKDKNVDIKTGKPIIKEYMTTQEAYTETIQLIKKINRELCFEKIGIYTKGNKTVQFPDYAGYVEITNPIRNVNQIMQYDMKYKNFQNDKFQLLSGKMSDHYIFKGVGWDKTLSNIGDYEFHFFPKNVLNDKKNYLTVFVNVNAKYINMDDKNCSVIIQKLAKKEEVFHPHFDTNEIVSMIYKLPDAEAEKMKLTEEQQEELINSVRGVLDPKSSSSPIIKG